MANTYRELPAPQSAKAGEQAVEICRAWIVDGALHVSMQRAFDDPSVWGVALLDIARHAARMHAAEGDMTYEAALERIGQLWRAEMDNPTELGTTQRQ